MSSYELKSFLIFLTLVKNEIATSLSLIVIMNYAQLSFREAKRRGNLIFNEHFRVFTQKYPVFS
jgi:hypothetical protein